MFAEFCIFTVIFSLVLVHCIRHETWDRCINCAQKLYKYFSTVFINSKKKNTNVSPFVTKLNTYSQKMQSWYEQCESDSIQFNEDSSSSDYGSSSESENEGNFVIQNCEKKTVGCQTVPLISTWRTESLSLYEENENNNRSKQFSKKWNHHDPLKIQSCNLQSIRRIQQEQVQRLLRQLKYYNERDVKAPLIICVEANSSNISGYLLNLRAKVCKFYVYTIENLPFGLDTTPEDCDNTEFKMKNLLFALLLWEEEILRMQKFSLFANCWAINNQTDSEYGKVATEFIEHFTYCENVIRVNSNSQVSRYRDTALFARLMQPARELMTWNLFRFRQYIRNAYGILNFEGSHSFLDDYKESAKDSGYFAKTYCFQYFLNKVNKNAKKWCASCCRCHFKLPRSMDLKGENCYESSDPSDSEIIPYPLTDNYW